MTDAHGTPDPTDLADSGTLGPQDSPDATQPDVTERPDQDDRRGRVVRWIRVGLGATSAALVLTAGLVVPMPYVESRPGDVIQTTNMMAISADTTEINGQIGLLTVRIVQTSMLATVRAWMDDDRRLRPAPQVYQDDGDHRTYMARQRDVFRRAFTVAAGVGLQAAGHDVVLHTVPQVVGVLPDSPADGVLQPGDLIREYDGIPVTTVQQIIDHAEGTRDGQAINLRVERNGVNLPRTVVAGEVTGMDRPGMGVRLQDADDEIELPFAVDLIDQQGIGGPSAGLMMALTIYDLVSDQDLAAGRLIVGTGTIDSNGVVGSVGSVAEKTVTAIAQGADIMLVPAHQVEAAQQVAQDRIRVIGVATFHDALEALGQVASADAPVTPPVIA
jgi:Lon-like protease